MLLLKAIKSSLIFSVFFSGALSAQTQSVVSLYLVRSDNNQKIMDIKSGDTINLATLPSRDFSIRAATNPSTVGSVKFALDSNANFKIENQIPYTLSGDAANLYPMPWAPLLKTYSLTATPYTRSAGAGTRGEALSINFRVIDQEPPKVSSFELVNSDTNAVIGPLINAQVLDLSKLPKNFSIRAKTSPASVGSVKLALDTDSKIENISPYTLTGDKLNLYPIPWVPELKEYKLTGTAYSDSSASGIYGSPLSITFKVIDQTSIANLPPTTIPEGLIPRPWDLAKITKNKYHVSTLAQFNEALKVAGPGDGILIAAGTYQWGAIQVPSSVQGSAAEPIIIRSDNGPVVFKGSTGGLTVKGNYIHVQGLSFEGTAKGVVIYGAYGAYIKGNRASMIHCKGVLGKCTYNDYSLNTRVDHSLMEEGKDKTVYIGNNSHTTRVDHNLFRNITATSFSGGNPVGGEAVQLGSSAYGTVDSQIDRVNAGTLKSTNMLVDHNVFQNAQGEGEMIGIKTVGAKVVYNVIVDAKFGFLSFRAGHHNLAFGNVFRRTQAGIVINGVAPKILNNLIVDPTGYYSGIQFQNGSDEGYIVPEENNQYLVRYIAARNGIIRNNSVSLTNRYSTSNKGLWNKEQQTACHPKGLITCDLFPFDNLIQRNMVSNRRTGGAWGISSSFAAENSFANNAHAISNGATVGSLPTSVQSAFKLADTATTSHLDSLTSFVWSAPQTQCLRLNSPGIIDSTIGAPFSPGDCEKAGEDIGDAWLSLNLADLEMIKDQSILINKLKAMPAGILPKIPAYKEP